MTDKKEANYAHCLAALRDTDRDRYLACLLAPEEKRGALAALYAFYAEIARVRDVVREALPGEIRLQWWRDLLEGKPDGEAAANPLAAGLLACIAEHRLPIAVLTDMIEARIFDLYNDPMESRPALEGYAGETASALIQLASLVLDPQKAPQSAVAAGHAGATASRYCRALAARCSSAMSGRDWSSRWITRPRSVARIASAPGAAGSTRCVVPPPARARAVDGAIRSTTGGASGAGRSSQAGLGGANAIASCRPLARSAPPVGGRHS